jgi:hypothetical protein
MAGAINNGIRTSTQMRVCEYKDICDHDQGMEQSKHLESQFEELNRQTEELKRREGRVSNTEKG